MPKVSVYLSDDLYVEARAQGLSLSTLAQNAVEQALRAARTEWVQRVRSRPPRVTRPIDTKAALDAAREELGA